MIKLKSLVENKFNKLKRINEYFSKPRLSEGKYSDIVKFCIDRDGKVIDIGPSKTHGLVVFDYPRAYDMAIKLYGTDDAIRKASLDGKLDLNAILYNTGFIRGFMQDGILVAAFNDKCGYKALTSLVDIAQDKGKTKVFVDYCNSRGDSDAVATKEKMDGTVQDAQGYWSLKDLLSAF